MARVDEQVDGGRRAAERDQLGAALLQVIRVRVRVRVRDSVRIGLGLG